MNTGYHDLRAVLSKKEAGKIFSFPIYAHKWAIGPTIATRNLISVTKNATFSFASIEKD